MIIRQHGDIIIEENEDLSKPSGGGIHPFFELLCLTKGEARLEWIGHSYSIAAPSLFILTPNTPHRLYSLARRCEGWYIELEAEDSGIGTGSAKRWNDMQQQWNWQTPVAMIMADSLHTLSSILLHRLQVQAPDVFGGLLESELRKLFRLILWSTEQPIPIQDRRADIPQRRATEVQHDRKRPSAQEQMIQIVRYIESNYMTEISLSDLSDRSLFTPPYIIKLIKEITGLTPVRYIHELRMHAALSYLHATDMSVKEIAESIGFNSIHYFSRKFKQMFGESPTQSRTRFRMFTSKHIDSAYVPKPE